MIGKSADKQTFIPKEGKRELIRNDFRRKSAKRIQHNNNIVQFKLASSEL